MKVKGLGGDEKKRVFLLVSDRPISCPNPLKHFQEKTDCQQSKRHCDSVFLINMTQIW